MTLRPLRLALAVQLLVAVPLLAQRPPEAAPPQTVTQDTALREDCTSSWDVPVKDACVVDSVTVSGVKDFAVEDFTTAPPRVAEDAIKATAEAKAACDKVKEKCKTDLAKKAWDEGNKRCSAHVKGQNAAVKCKATRGNLHLNDITVESCTFEGIEGCQGTGRTLPVTGTDGIVYRVPIRSCTKWRARVDCTAPDVLYVCDP